MKDGPTIRQWTKRAHEHLGHRHLMVGPNILMYFPWSRPDEEGAPLGKLDNRFGALFELRRLQWPKYENLADSGHFNQGIAGFFDNIFLANYSLFREDMRIRSGNAVRCVERCTSAGKMTPIDGDLLGGTDILIVVSFDSQRTDQFPRLCQVAASRSGCSRVQSIWPSAGKNGRRLAGPYPSRFSGGSLQSFPGHQISAFASASAALGDARRQS
jgi:hypothetical protein